MVHSRSSRLHFQNRLIRNHRIIASSSFCRDAGVNLVSLPSSLLIGEGIDLGYQSDVRANRK
jgi:hypothetical protein